MMVRTEAGRPKLVHDLSQYRVNPLFFLALAWATGGMFFAV